MSSTQAVSVSKEAPLKGIFMSNPVCLNFTANQSELIGVVLISLSFFQSIWGRRGWGVLFGLYHPPSPTFLCSLAQVMVNSLLQMKLAALL